MPNTARGVNQIPKIASKNEFKLCVQPRMQKHILKMRLRKKNVSV